MRVIQAIKVNACQLHCRPFVPPPPHTLLDCGGAASRAQGGARRGRDAAFDASLFSHQRRKRFTVCLSACLKRVEVETGRDGDGKHKDPRGPASVGLRPELKRI